MQNTDKIPVNDIYLCLQGEGVMTGTPMLLVRLQGCAVGCSFCDTKETWHMADVEHEVDDIVGKWQGQNGRFTYFAPKGLAHYCRMEVDYQTVWEDGNQWILLTGGEPANYELTPLIESLHRQGFKVAIETSGTATGHLGSGIDWVTVSPKINQPGGLEIVPSVLEQADELKFVIGGQKSKSEMLTCLDGLYCKEGQVISVQPMSGSLKMTKMCIEMCNHYGYRLSLQTHKLLDLR